MHLNELDLSKAPESGQVLAYTRHDVIFQAYKNIDEIQDLMSRQELLELHLFDSDKEYRAIASGSPRFSEGKIEYIADFPEEDEKQIYKEAIELENGMGVITVLNHIAYSEDSGSAYMDDYRLKMGGGYNG